jgi:hypothetical protein
MYSKINKGISFSKVIQYNFPLYCLSISETALFILKPTAMKKN